MVPDVAGSSPVDRPIAVLVAAHAAGGTELDERTDLDLTVAPDVPWVTIVWNDPVNLMTYVARVFRTYFGFPPAEAERLMLLVHHEGKAVVATGSRELMERHTEAMHEFGLWASVAKADA